MTRVLPGVYVTFNDYSALPEGETNLNVGYVLAAPRGPVGKAELVTSPTDFLSKFTLSGNPTIKDDKTFWSILQVLKYTNQVYISRAGRNIKFGGLVCKTSGFKALGETEGLEDPNGYKFTDNDDLFIITGKDGGTYNNDLGIIIKTYVDNAKEMVNLFESKEVMEEIKPFQILVYDMSTPGEPLEEFLVSLKEDAKAFDGSTLYIKTVLESSAYIQCVLNENGKYEATIPEEQKARYTLGKISKDIEGTTQTWNYLPYEAATPTLTAEEGEDAPVEDGEDVPAEEETPAEGETPAGGETSEEQEPVIEYRWFKDTDTSKANPKTIEEFKSSVVAYTMKNSEVEAAGDSITISFEYEDRSDKIVAGTGDKAVQLGGGYEEPISKLDHSDAGKALSVFEDKTIPVSLIGNGSGAMYENPIYQQALIELANVRKDCMVFLNTRESDEKATMNSTKATNIIKYKKEDLGSTSYYGCMYGPHVNYSDVFNSRQVKLGADSTAIAGWLNVLLSRGYPYAYAGPQNGLVTGVTTNWKIGDTSGEAEVLNDASINYIAYDAKVGRYYMQCQNTLQIANSSLRNIGAVLNVLDIKETFMTYFKEYLQLPITARLREEILQKGKDYMETSIKGMSRCIDYSFVDATTDTDLSNNTLRYILAIALTPYAQKIYLAMNIVNANYDFSITQGA